jgi:hypothetical protein
MILAFILITLFIVLIVIAGPGYIAVEMIGELIWFIVQLIIEGLFEL